MSVLGEVFKFTVKEVVENEATDFLLDKIPDDTWISLLNLKEEVKELLWFKDDEKTITDFNELKSVFNSLIDNWNNSAEKIWKDFIDYLSMIVESQSQFKITKWFVKKSIENYEFYWKFKPWSKDLIEKSLSFIELKWLKESEKQKYIDSFTKNYINLIKSENRIKNIENKSLSIDKSIIKEIITNMYLEWTLNQNVILTNNNKQIKLYNPTLSAHN